MKTMRMQSMEDGLPDDTYGPYPPTCAWQQLCICYTSHSEWLCVRYTRYASIGTMW